eukprot:6226114-Prymnesium_polylepis.1
MVARAGSTHSSSRRTRKCTRVALGRRGRSSVQSRTSNISAIDAAFGRLLKRWLSNCTFGVPVAASTG